jgi:hypothetical protein
MSKKGGFGKFMLFCAAAGAAAAGAYYYLSKREEELVDGFDDDDFDDFEDFEDDDLEASSESKFGSRKYVDITSGSDASKDEEPAPAKEEDAPESSEEFFDDEDK